MSSKVVDLYTKVCALLTDQTTGDVVSGLLGVIYSGAGTREEVDAIHSIVLLGASAAHKATIELFEKEKARASLS